MRQRQRGHVATPTPTPTPTPAPSGGTTITITSAGVSPATITVARGSQVTFVNNDTQNHDELSDPRARRRSSFNRAGKARGVHDNMLEFDGAPCAFHVFFHYRPLAMSRAHIH